MAIDYPQLARRIKQWALELGFQQLGITATDLSAEEPRLQAWLNNDYHGDMHYMAEHGLMRARPTELLPGTLRVLSVRMDYLPEKAGFATNLADPAKAYISRYALGRDYHKLVRNRLKQLAVKISTEIPELNFRPFVDSAPVLERPLAQRAGLGWIGKHSLLLNHDGGSWFFLGELLVDIPLPVDEPHQGDCGSCVACITSCPTGAIVAPYVVDGRRCISYLTIELKTAIPEALRPLMGNRIYGCDDCQLVCPQNREAPLSIESDFQRRVQWQDQDLLQLFAWDEATFLRQTEGSAIRRIGYERWQRNIAVALGNAPYQLEIITALQQARAHSSELVTEHIDWALAQQKRKSWQADNLLPRPTERLIRIIQKGLPRDA
ncbi:tRNA epoxyqueuosine(34) reductase QueG [Arsukibacterium sp. UBA3155]|uniref:tRNA epoxyqueuosine(34) reductase QueG n=1 Tax=Arsukibacterium sp. UBA3155 TaxID=1946058 RepID=UPI0025BFFF15|nr:tRNA epoxyqueuosine(34) reductase QueG [Arsukibacterium sp. UBA3155]|tara:strand:- start:33395 stop:34528 length:1134 start_codon:yes stop_codon:yes gene_type:complete